MQRRAMLAALAAGVGASRPARAAEPGATGTGATFPAKVYQQWAEQYSRDTGVAVSYEPKGSSAGVKQIVARAVDFGATDVPMKGADLDRHGLFQFPTLVGGVVPVVNLPGIATGALRLDGATLAAVFSGRITNWRDRAIAALNPQLALPDLPIERVVRSDGSGTTEVFVGYLNQMAPDLKLAVKSGKAAWAGEVASADGSSQLVKAVKATPGAISYISSDYALRDKLIGVALRNRRGEWAAPTLAAYGAAIRASALFRDSMEAGPLLDIDGVGVWPIVTATYVVVPRAPTDLQRAGRTLNFFYRSFLLGDKAVAGTGFAPLPVATQARIVKLLSEFRTPSGERLPMLG